jgi:hypothetical protein
MTGAGSVAQMPIRTGADVVRVRQLVRGHAQAVRCRWSIRPNW